MPNTPGPADETAWVPDDIPVHDEVVPIPTYDPAWGVRGWCDHADVVAVSVASNGEVVLQANELGLRSLARDLLALAQQGVPDGSEVFRIAKGQAPTLAAGSPSLRLVRRGTVA